MENAASAYWLIFAMHERLQKEGTFHFLTESTGNISNLNVLG